MLKWTVNAPRQSYLQNKNINLEFPATSGSSTQPQRARLKRKSSDVNSLRPKMSWLDKENQYTSTPLNSSNRNIVESPSRKLDSLKDLSNIVPEVAVKSPLRVFASKLTFDVLKTPENHQNRKNLPSNYASTLPTFDVEYSPCGLIPGPILALRGVGIPDSYFEKPRYITPYSKEDGGVSKSNKKPIELAQSTQKPVESILKYPSYMEESNLSSTKMGDVTLERMIDAILESNRKERKPSKSQKFSQQPDTDMSPTYTPAEDPASDLHEIWDSEKARYRQKEQTLKTRSTKRSLFNENEIRSAAIEQERLYAAGELRRQRGVRRKRKITQITACVMNSAQKLLGKNTTAQSLSMQSYNPRKLFNSELTRDEIRPLDPLRNPSPDSGHNSTSDYEEVEDDATLEGVTGDNKTLQNTKASLTSSAPKANK